MDLKTIKCRFVECKHMIAGVSWRINLELPSTDEVIASLAILLREKVNATIKAGGITAVIEPAYIHDIATVGKRDPRFHLVIETVYESQFKPLSPKLLLMTNTEAILSITPHSETPAIQIKRGTIALHALKGLHVTFFQSQEFWEFLETIVNVPISSPEECKAHFKCLMGVESCKEIDQQEFDSFRERYSAWRTGYKHAA